MGNNPSRASSSNPQSPAGGHHGGVGLPLSSRQQGASAGGLSASGIGLPLPPVPRRRESIQALPNPKATAAPPEPVLESTTAHAFARSAHRHPQQDRKPERARANTTSATAAPSIHSALQSSQQAAIPQAPTPKALYPPAFDPFASFQAPDRMGSDQSKQKDHHSHHHYLPTRPAREATASPPARPSPLTKPVDVPAPSADAPARHNASQLESGSSAFSEKYQLPDPAQYSRPPRLPLPIEEEIHTPGSPIISPADLALPLDPIDVDGVLPRRTSVLSSTTVDDDDEVEDLNAVDGEIRPTVPTLIEWKGPGEKVYVTGTFAGWDRKFRLHRDPPIAQLTRDSGPSPHKDALSAIINLIPGTHHLKFIVDGEMRLSDDLPTAVDFTNILVNYIEVSPDQLQQSLAERIAGASPTETSAPEIVTPHVEQPPAIVPVGVHPPQVLPPTPEIQPVSGPSTTPSAIPDAPPGSSKPAPVAPGAPKEYHNVIPKFLADLDASEESTAFGRANAAVSNLPAPPTLPMFLSRSILNGATPMKDDASVLNMPNHTVLNHLATSSIRNNVLATSATTRYKRKFLTTIMYKPTNEFGD